MAGRPRTRPEIENHLAAGIAAGTALLVPFALLGIERAQHFGPWLLPATVVLWTWLGLLGAAAFRVRPVEGRRLAFEVWFSLFLVELASYAAVVWHGAAAFANPTGCIPAPGPATQALFLGSLVLGFVPPLFLVATAENAGRLFVMTFLAPVVLPVAVFVFVYLVTLFCAV